ncbi:MAG: T9SS type A sorting domain-containing protein [Dysgonamonadaceae bacterium]|nr:T9SS type A sorting domain-containing protein [Dysgonamonadaceae bacterium]
MKTKCFILLCVSAMLFFPSRAQVLKAPAASLSGALVITGSNDKNWKKISKIQVVFGASFSSPYGKNIIQMFANDNESQYNPQLYTVDSKDQKNTVQYELTGDYVIEVPLGIKIMSSSDYYGTYLLTFENTLKLGLESLYLIDKVNGNAYIDLFKNSEYTFEHKDGNLSNRFILLAGKQLAMPDYLMADAGVQNTIDVVANDHIGSCTADSPGSLTIKESPTHGSAVVQGGTILKYTPLAGWYGLDSLSYQLESCDGSVGSAKAYILTHKPLEAQYTACPGSDATLGFNHLANVEYFWYDASTGGSPVKFTSSDTLHIVKGDPQDIGVWWAEAVADGMTFARVPVTLEASDECVTALYWNPAATDNNWNNPANWLDDSGLPAMKVPDSFTTVHIPGNASAFPSLDYSSAATCDNIIFHFGAELAKPQYLHYNKAFVQYNFGYYDAGHNLQSSFDPYSSAPMKRQQWYALSAPLKKIVTGDFAFGGYPYTWQRGFRSSRDRGSDVSGGWYDPEANVALEIGARQNYAISLYVPRYDAGTTGLNDQRYLDNLHGIIELPYFQNADVAADHPMQTYSDGISKIHYYDAAFNILPDHYDEIARGDEAYRFIFEDNNNNPQTEFYITVPVVDNDGDGQPDEVMVANPFVSSFDFISFFEANSDKLENYYRLYSGGSFNVFIPSIENAPIAPLQAFFIKPSGAIGSDVQLLFNADEQSITRTGENQLKSTGTVETQLPKGVVKITADNGSGSSWIFMDFIRPTTNNIDRMFATDDEGVPQLYSVDGLNFKNTLQFAPNGSEVRLGIRADVAGRYRLSFENALNSGVEALYLLDRQNPDALINLFETETYTFDHVQGEDLADRFTLLIGKQVSGVEQLVDDSDQVQVYAVDDMLSVVSNQLIDAVDILSIQGVRVASAEAVNATHLEKQLTVKTGVYLVKVTLADGKTFVEKIIVK